jgi:hypothetical protein
LKNKTGESSAGLLAILESILDFTHGYTADKFVYAKLNAEINNLLVL